MTLAEYRVAEQRLWAEEADGHLADGTPFFGVLGEIAHDRQEDLVQCHLCGEWFKWFGCLHLKYRHPGWTIEDYRGSLA